jgi:hypothetical protein
VVNGKRVARIMREHEIAGLARRKSRSLAKQDRTAPPAPDLVQRAGEREPHARPDGGCACDSHHGRHRRSRPARVGVHWISSRCGWSGDTGQRCSCRS